MNHVEVMLWVSEYTHKRASGRATRPIYKYRIPVPHMRIIKLFKNALVVKVHFVQRKEKLAATRPLQVVRHNSSFSSITIGKIISTISACTIPCASAVEISHFVALALNPTVAYVYIFATAKDVRGCRNNLADLFEPLPNIDGKKPGTASLGLSLDSV